MIPEPIRKFADTFSSLPSIGPRQAIRLAFYIINSGKGSIQGLASAIAGLQQLKTCPFCFFIHDSESHLCYICDNPQRRKDIIMVVEKETDLISLEKTNKFNGRYFVIGNLKKNGVLETEQKLKINNLKARDKAEEIILAINPTTYGDINAGLLAHELKDCAKKITRLGRGIPTGGEIEFADEETLGSALDNRG